MRPRNAESNICILSGLEIPHGKYSWEHFYPKSCLPEHLANNPYNIWWAVRVYNNVKGNLLPCVWMERRYSLCYNAVQNWNLKRSDRLLLQIGLEDGLPDYDPCYYCIANKVKEFCLQKR